MNPASFTQLRRIFLFLVKKKFTTRTARQWVGLPGEVGWPPSLGVFKTQMDKARSNLVWFHSRPCFEQEVALDDFLRPLPTSFSLWVSEIQMRSPAATENEVIVLQHMQLSFNPLYLLQRLLKWEEDTRKRNVGEWKKRDVVLSAGNLSAPNVQIFPVCLLMSGKFGGRKMLLFVR